MYCYTCMKEYAGADTCPICKNSKKVINSPHHITPGTVLANKYTVGNPLGEGGFGITYAGLDNTLQVKVAIKEFFPSGYVNRNNTYSNDVTVSTQKQKDFFEGGKEKFLQEARSVARFLDEDGIVSVRDFFEDNNTAYIVMEFLDGSNLNDHIKLHGKMKAREIFTLLLPIMESLSRVHDGGIIHRDISPENIMFLKKGYLKLMDFGAARQFEDHEKSMSVMLKQGYAPEEQYRRNGVQGPWTDVYGLCATIYKCITGVVPDDGLDRLYEDNLKKPSELGADISPSLENALMYGLAVHAKNRCKDMKELATLVKQGLNDKTSASASAPVQRATDANKTIIADDISTPATAQKPQFTPPVVKAPTATAVTVKPQTPAKATSAGKPQTPVLTPVSAIPNKPAATTPANNPQIKVINSNTNNNPAQNNGAAQNNRVKYPITEKTEPEKKSKKGKKIIYTIIGIAASLGAAALIDQILEEIIGFGLF